MKEPALPQKLIETLAKSKDALVVSGAPEGVDAAGLAEAARLRGGVTLFVARDETRASQFEAAAKFFVPELETLRLPAWDTLPYDRNLMPQSLLFSKEKLLKHLIIKGL